MSNAAYLAQMASVARLHRLPVRMQELSSSVRMPIGCGEPVQRKAMEDFTDSGRSEWLPIEVYFIAHWI